MNILIIEQDLRVSGTSQGIISRSFLAKLRKSYPNALIHVEYLKTCESEDQLELLPVNSINTHILKIKVPFYIKLYNKIYWRFFNVSLNERYVQKVYKECLSKIDYKIYDYIFIRSGGLDHENLLGARDLPLLKKAIITFHEPYPTFWCSGSSGKLTNLDLFRFKNMQEVVKQAKGGLATPSLSRDMQYLYGSVTKFYELPHQYDESVFDLSKPTDTFKKTKNITICYHGAIQFGRDINTLLDVYQELLDEDEFYKENTEFVLRLKNMVNINALRLRYQSNKNIKVLGSQYFFNAAFEQSVLADINILLENGPLYCSVLLGKAPFLAAYNKPVLCLSPERSDLKDIIKEKKYIANYNNRNEIKQKLKFLIDETFQSDNSVQPFGDFFSDDNFKRYMDEVINNR